MFNETDISFETEDGWTIHGTLSVPKSLEPGERVPGVVLVHSPAHDQDIYLGLHMVGRNTQAKESLRSALGKTVTLRIDIRGRGKSEGRQAYHRMSRDQRARVALDVIGAIEYLSRREEIDSNRIGVVAEGESAEAAVGASFSDQRVRAVVLLSGRLQSQAKDEIGRRYDLPVLCIVSKEDKISLVDMAEAFSRSRNPASDLLLYRNIGAGSSMFIMWANKFPEEKSLESTVAEWLGEQLLSAPELREVSFQSEDGWTLYGSLRLPRRSDGRKAPGVILLHSYLTDRNVFDNLERMLSTEGFAVLNFDFRGRGKSIAKGTYFELDMEERDRAYLDARAAADHLASQDEVDENRIAVVASSIGVKYGLKAAVSDDRVKSFVMLGGMPDRDDVEKAHFPILFASSLGLPQIAEAFREFYRIKKSHGSQLFEFEGGAVGYQVFDLDDTLQPLIVRWLKPQMTIP